MYLILVHKILENKTFQNLACHRHRAGRWKSDKQARHVRANAILTVSNTYFLVPSSGQLIHCLKISVGNKNNEAEIAKKLRTVQPEPKVTGSYKKACVLTSSFLYNNNYYAGGGGGGGGGRYEVARGCMIMTVEMEPIL